MMATVGPWDLAQGLELLKTARMFLMSKISLVTADLSVDAIRIIFTRSVGACYSSSCFHL
jgi:hypothetical protein